MLMVVVTNWQNLNAEDNPLRERSLAVDPVGLSKCKQEFWETPHVETITRFG
jgi:hypothetical protein